MTAPGDRLARPSLLRRLEWWALIAFVLLTYGARLSTLTIRGEESRRATVAMWMHDSGDWVVPRQQGDARFMSSRPPLQSWLMAGAAAWRGDMDRAAVRLPSVAAVLATTLLVYAYATTFLSRRGGLAAGLVYATFAQVLELGRLGETDALFTTWLGGALLTWHLGRRRQWPAALTWTVSYLLVALATLTKGPQAPVYFAGGVGVHLLLTRQWTFLFSAGHALGLLTGAAVFGAWLVPFWRAVGWEGLRHTLGGDVSLYLADWSPGHVAGHWAGFPFETLACLLPWTVLLWPYARGQAGRAAGGTRESMRYLWTCIAVAYPTVWLVPGTNTRFFMPLYPCFAILIAYVIEDSLAAGCPRPTARLWRGFMVTMAALMALAGPVLLILTLLPGVPTGQPPLFAALYAAAALLLAGVTWRARDGAPLRRFAGVVAVALFMALTSSGAILNQKASVSNDVASQVASVKSRLPPDARLVSFGHTHHLFAYHYRDPIAAGPWVGPDDPAPADVTWFCALTPVSFPHEVIGRVTCDRTRKEPPEQVVTVGRVLR